MFSPHTEKDLLPFPLRLRALTTPPILMIFLSQTFYSQVRTNHTHFRTTVLSSTDLIYLFIFLSVTNQTEPDFKSKDWVFLNYTYKRFEGLTQRGTIPPTQSWTKQKTES